MALLPRLRCPHCGERAIRWWVASGSAPSRPARCRECGGLSHLSLTAYLFMMIGAHIAFLVGIIVPLALQNVWALALLPLGLAAVMLLASCFPLLTTTPEAAEHAQGRARRSAAWAMGLLAAFIVWTLLHQFWPN